MRKMWDKNRPLLFSLASLVVLLALCAAPSKADTYTFDTDHCSGGCGTPLGTVTVVQEGANTVDITVAMGSPGMLFAVGGAGGDNQFFFNLGPPSVDNPTISVSDITAGFKLVSTTAGSYAGDGLSGDFEYAITCHYAGGACPGGGTSNHTPFSLNFDVTAAGLTPASFDDSGGTSGADTAQFAADVLGSTGNTGLIGAKRVGVTTHGVPEPGTLLLLGTGLLGLVGSAKRKFLA